MKKYPVAPEHFVADSALFGLAIDVLEQSLAVQLLRDSEVPRAAFANARAAFEAGQDALYLTSDESRYDDYGCLARVHELNEDERIVDRFKQAQAEDEPPLAEFRPAQAVVDEEAAAWDRVVPGSGDCLRRAFETFHARPGQQKKHWTGLNRGDIALAVADQLAAESGVGEMYNAMYGSLASQSHPRMRVNQRAIESESDGAFLAASKPEDRVAPGSAATFGCISALVALKRRRDFFTGAV